MPSKSKDIIGQKFNRLLVLEKLPNTKRTDGLGTVSWHRCHCDCGNLFDVRTSQLTFGRSKSCGCLNKELSRERIKQGKPIRGSDSVSKVFQHIVPAADGTRPKSGGFLHDHWMQILRNENRQ